MLEGDGEVAERLMAPLSKSGILSKNGIVGSNPTLSAKDLGLNDDPPVRFWRDVRAAEGARLEIVCAVNSGAEGSNPSLSASFISITSPDFPA
jgi:hypothetical protein